MKRRLTPLISRRVAVCTMIALVAQALAGPVHAGEAPLVAKQTGAASATVENLQTSFSSGVVTITYDLTAFESPSSFDVTLEVSTDGGQTYDVQPRSMSGDVGRPVSSGRGKRIVWEFAKDVENLQINQFRFRIVIRIEARSGAAASEPEQPSERRPGVQPPSSALSTTRRPSRGNRLLWPGLVMFGAGGALAALAGAGPLRTRTDYPGYYELTPSKPGMYGGIGVAATGLVLVLLGRRGQSSAAVVVPVPGGIMLSRVTAF